MKIKTPFRQFILLALFGFAACKKHENLNPMHPNAPVDVYVGGVVAAGTIPVYWKNGVLSTGDDSNPGSIVSGIAVSGTDVYLAGDAITDGDDPDEYAAYWKNGVIVPLSIFSSDAEAISINSGSVFIAGTIDSGLNEDMVYWKNGVSTFLAYNSSPSGIAVSGPDVYISSGNGYWKNGVFTALPASTSPSSAYGIVVSGSDVYVPGTAGPLSSSIPLYWKNGTAHPLAAAADSSVANGIAVNGSNVYVSGIVLAGSTGHVPTAVYWKNGVETQLTYSTYSTWAYAIAVNGTDVYVAGYANTGIGKPPIPLIWKNGTATALAAENAGGVATCLVLVPK